MRFILRSYAAVTLALEKLTWLPLLAARLSVGSIFILTGWGKLHDLPKVIAFFTDLGVPFPEINARLVGATELCCGTLILVGLLTRFASVPLTITMIIAILTAKMSDISNVFDLLGLDEFLYIVFFAIFIVRGAGKISLDAALSHMTKSKS